MQILIMNLIWRLLPKIFYTTIAMKIKKSSLIGFTHPSIVEPFLYYLECMSSWIWYIDICHNDFNKKFKLISISFEMFECSNRGYSYNSNPRVRKHLMPYVSIFFFDWFPPSTNRTFFILSRMYVNIDHESDTEISS